MWRFGLPVGLTWVLLATSCACMSGPKAANRVLGGELAREGEFPFMAYINYNGPRSLCGATIIDKAHILTAAHCALQGGVPMDPAGKQVLIGTINFRRGGKILTIDKVMVHHKYNATTVDNDIAVLRVVPAHTIIFRASDPPPKPMASVELAPRDDSCCGHGDKTNLIVAGWGKTEQAASSDHLRKGQVQTAAMEECAKDDTKICASSSLKSNICYGDSGGPVLRRLADGRLLQVGITSTTVSSNCQAGMTATRVAAYRGWIDECRCGTCKTL